MSCSPDSSDMDEPEAKRQKIINDDDFLYGSNLVLLKVNGKVIAHAPIELFNDACVPGAQLDDPDFWHDVGDLDGLRYTSLDCGTDKNVARFLAYWINGKEVDECFGIINIGEGAWYAFFFTIYEFCVGRGIFNHELQRELINHFIRILSESKATAEKTIETQHQLQHETQQQQETSNAPFPSIGFISHQLRTRFPHATPQKIRELATERLRLQLQGAHQLSHQQACQIALHAARGPHTASMAPNHSLTGSRNQAVLHQNNGSDQHGTSDTRPPDNQQSWLTNAFEAYEGSEYHDKHLDSLFAALFIHHYPRYLDADEDDGSRLSPTLQAMRARALSYFSQTRYGDDRALVEDPLTVDYGRHHWFYLSPPSGTAPNEHQEGSNQYS